MAEPTAANAMEPATGYRCPGQGQAISRAVHLGRLARFYPPCRQCPFRDETGSLSARQVRRLAETRHRGGRGSPFHEEGAAGVYLNDLGPDEARRMAAALGVLLKGANTSRHEPPGLPRRPGTCGDKPRGSVGMAPQTSEVSETSEVLPHGPPEVVVAGDGRPLAAELVAGAAEGLRWAGCGVVEVGQATSPCVASAAFQLGAAGGMLVGNPTGRPEIVGLKFWAGRAEPLSAGGLLEQLRRLFEAGIDRPARRFGPLRRWQAEDPYLAGLRDYYHALRPLRVVLSATCRPAVGYLEKLTGPVACEVLPCPAPFGAGLPPFGAGLPTPPIRQPEVSGALGDLRSSQWLGPETGHNACPAPPDRLGQEVRDHRAHLGAILGDDGETALVLDETGRPVSGERLLVLLAGHLLAEQPGGVVVLEEGTSPEMARQIVGLGGRIESSHRSRAGMDRAMRDHGALLGGGPSGRFWHRVGEGLALPDGVRTLTLLLRVLSQSDRPLSAVVDRGAPAA